VDCPPAGVAGLLQGRSARPPPEINIRIEKQTAASVPFEGDVAVVVVVPETVEIVEVPAFRGYGYGYVMLNDRRV
jgi:hypothetical protein